MILAVVIIAMTANSVRGQKVIVDQKKVDDLTAKIQECKVKIARNNNDLAKAYDYTSDINKLKSEIDTLNKKSFDTEYGKTLRDASVKGKVEELKTLQKKQNLYTNISWKKTENEALLVQIKKYESEKSRIFDSYVAETSVPKELSRRELKLRKRGLEIGEKDMLLTVETKRENRIENNQAKREDLGFQKMLNATVNADPVNGYEGFVWNLTNYTKVNFTIYSIDDYGKVSLVETVSFLTNPGERKIYNLIPGAYRCVVEYPNAKPKVWTFHVSPQKHYVLGEWTHWSVWKQDS